MSFQVLNEEKASLQELLRGADDVLDHPILRAIVEAAPSPDDAYRHITDLGWEHEVARKVRLAVRARRRVPKEVWDKEYASTVRSANAMFRFGYFTPPLSITHFTTMEHLHSIAVRFGGEEVPCDNWPFFLREFWLRDGEFYVTSVDFRGSGRLFSCRVASGLDDKLWYWLGGKQPLLYAKGRQGESGEFCIRVTDADQAMFYLYWLPDSGIHSQIKQMNVPGEPFPRFYKTVQVGRDHGCSIPGERAEYERIRVLLRLDTHPTNPTNQSKIASGRGEVWYEHFIPVSRAANAVLRLRYKITHELALEFDQPEKEGAHLRYLGVEYKKGWPLQPGEWQCPGDPAELAKAMVALHADLAKMLKRAYAYASRPLISLESIAGFSLVTNPPERLADLFC